MSDRKDILKKILKLANVKYPSSEIYLYGSQARGNANASSDWDLLVLLNSKQVPFEVEIELMDEFYELELETGAVISPLIYSKVSWNTIHSATPLFSNIQKDSIQIK